MIHVDISNIWGQLSLPQLLSVETELSAAQMTLCNTENAHCHWLDLPNKAPTAEHMRILAAAHRIRETSDVLVVIGSGGACIGAQAAITLRQGPGRNLRSSKGDPQVYFAGMSLSTRHWNELTKNLEGKDFCLCVISETGEELESAIAFRSLKWMLERRYGTAQAKRRIYAVTGESRGCLRHMAEEEGWECFVYPAGVGGAFGVLSAAGLLPMAAAGLDVMSMLSGAARVRKECDLRSFENPLWLYTAARCLMERRGRCIELLESFEAGFSGFGRWWQQLFGGCGGIFPGWGELPGDLNALEGMIRRGNGCMMETVVRFDPPKKRMTIGQDVWDMDGLNYLAGTRLDQVEEQVCQGIMASHADEGCPVICIECEELNDENLGGLFYFFQMAAALCAALQGTDPMDRSAIEAQRQNIFDLLGRPAE